jgi:hypothetical protein
MDQDDYRGGAPTPKLFHCGSPRPASGKARIGDVNIAG